MAENSKIGWTTHTFNPWLGCTKVSFACDNCYAEGWAKRTGHGALWQGERRRTTEDYWRQPTKWNKRAESAPERPRVFCASLADVFDNQVPAQWRGDLWALIRATPHLDWLLLTKRPQNIRKMLPADWCDGYPNVWLGTTVENRDEMLRRGPLLKSVPAKVCFWSAEPLLGDLGGIPAEIMPDWIIVGGESGPGARPMHPDWARSIRDQCAAAGVPFFFKQWGEWAPVCSMSEEQIDACYHPARENRPEASRREKITSIVMHSDGQMFRGKNRYCFGAFMQGAGSMTMFQVGKKAASRRLDGAEHNGMPEKAAPAPRAHRQLRRI